MELTLLGALFLPGPDRCARAERDLFSCRLNQLWDRIKAFRSIVIPSDPEDFNSEADLPRYTRMCDLRSPHDECRVNVRRLHDGVKKIRDLSTQTQLSVSALYSS